MICSKCKLEAIRIVKKKCYGCYNADYTRVYRETYSLDGKSYREWFRDYNKKYKKSGRGLLANRSRQKARRVLTSFFKNSNSIYCCICNKPGFFKFQDGRKQIRGLDISHKDKDCFNNKLENLWLLCRDCHLNYDKQEWLWESVRPHRVEVDKDWNITRDLTS